MGEVIYIIPLMGEIIKPVEGNSLPLPFFNGTVPAGFPSPAEDYEEEVLNLHDLVVVNPAATFFIRIDGDSMVGAGILDGSIVAVDRSLPVVSNSVVIAAVDGMPTVKWFIQEGRQCYLKPANPKYKTIMLEEGSELRVWGVVTYVVQKPLGAH